MNKRCKDISGTLKQAHHETSFLVEDIGTLLMHLREGISDANSDLETQAELCAADALGVLQELETRITDLQDKVALCTS